MTALICGIRSGLVPPLLIKMRLADQENWNSLTVFEPNVLLSLAISILLGWSQFESTAGNGSSPQSCSS